MRKKPPPAHLRNASFFNEFTLCVVNMLSSRYDFVIKFSTVSRCFMIGLFPLPQTSVLGNSSKLVCTSLMFEDNSKGGG